MKPALPFASSSGGQLPCSALPCPALPCPALPGPALPTRRALPCPALRLPGLALQGRDLHMDVPTLHVYMFTSTVVGLRCFLGHEGAQVMLYVVWGGQGVGGAGGRGEGVLDAASADMAGNPHLFCWRVYGLTGSCYPQQMLSVAPKACTQAGSVAYAHLPERQTVLSDSCRVVVSSRCDQHQMLAVRHLLLPQHASMQANAAEQQLQKTCLPSQGRLHFHRFLFPFPFPFSFTFTFAFTFTFTFTSTFTSLSHDSCHVTIFPL